MQCFCRVYFHRSISRIPDSGNNHQRHKQPCQGKSRQEASGIERHLAHIHQFGITDIESDDSRRYGRQRKQQHPFVHETGENLPARTAQRHPQRNLFTALLRTEPECADNTQKDIQQQETEHAKLRLLFVHVFQLADFAQMAERCNVQQIQITYLIKAVGIIHQLFGKVLIGIFGNAQADCDITGVTEIP